ncbi:MAG TPA: TatD family hydrolase [Candidatus Saccharimonadales bacterium]
MQLIDTHCHIHESSYPLDIEEVIANAHNAGVGQMICVGTDQKSSEEAVEFVKNRTGFMASIGVHPHETKDGWKRLEALNDPHVVAVGEIGLDYFYTFSPREVQVAALEEQIDLAVRRNLPIIFHVREAFDDFWPIFDNFHGIRGVLHSFTDSSANMNEGLKRGLYIGVNGISTFTKDEAQKAMFASVPLERMLLETDAPFLTPVPFRGKVNEPAFVQQIAAFHAGLKNLPVDQIAAVTTGNAQTLFNFS